MPDPTPLAPPERGDPPAPVVLAPVLLLTLLLSVWAAFLVPVRLDGVPLMLWLLPLAAMLAMAARAGTWLGLAGVLPPALLWLAVSWLALGARRAEGDLVVPATLSGQLYLYGGLLLWAAVVLRTQSRAR